MTLTGKTEKAFRQLVMLSTAVTGALVAATAAWAFIIPKPPAFPTIELPAPASNIPAVVALDPKPWQLNLWRPFIDAPAYVAPPPPPPPINFKLFSILKQTNGLTAAIVPGAGGGLMYVKSGEKIGEYTVVVIDGRGIEIEANGLRQRLELAP